MVEENHRRHLELVFPKEPKENTPLDKGSDGREGKERLSSNRLMDGSAQRAGQLDTIGGEGYR